MTTIERTITIPWLAASSSACRDIGSWTFQRSWRSVAPGRGGRLDHGLRHRPDPDVDEADDGRQRVDHGGDDRREAGRVEQRERRDQVDERGQRLGGVEERPQERPEAVAARRQDADDEADAQREQRAHDDVGERRHRVLPQAERR